MYVLGFRVLQQMQSCFTILASLACLCLQSPLINEVVDPAVQNVIGGPPDPFFSAPTQKEKKSSLGMRLDPDF